MWQEWVVMSALKRVVIAFAVFSALSLAAAQAGKAGDAANGETLARQWCGVCHLLPSGRATSDAVPPFEAIAQRPELSPGALKAWLSTPHPQMPNFELSTRDIDDLAAYLLSLRKE